MGFFEMFKSTPSEESEEEVSLPSIEEMKKNEDKLKAEGEAAPMDAHNYIVETPESDPAEHKPIDFEEPGLDGFRTGKKPTGWDDAKLLSDDERVQKQDEGEAA